MVIRRGPQLEKDCEFFDVVSFGLCNQHSLSISYSSVINVPSLWNDLTQPSIPHTCFPTGLCAGINRLANEHLIKTNAYFSGVLTDYCSPRTSSHIPDNHTSAAFLQCELSCASSSPTLAQTPCHISASISKCPTLTPWSTYITFIRLFSGMSSNVLLQRLGRRKLLSTRITCTAFICPGVSAYITALLITATHTPSVSL
jgi:hypothetical protein